MGSQRGPEPGWLTAPGRPKRLEWQYLQTPKRASSDRDPNQIALAAA